MARANWEYIRVDVLLPDHPKLDGLTYASKWTLIELWAHCGQHRTDGFVRDTVWQTKGTANARAGLVSRGLAERVRGGYQMHDYLGHQRSRAEIEALSAKRAAAGAKGGKARASATANAKQMLGQVPGPAGPVDKPPLPPDLPPDQGVDVPVDKTRNRRSAPSKRSKIQAEAEAEADLSEVHVVESAADRNGRATSEIADLIIGIIETRTGRMITEDQASAIAAGILTGRQPDNPAGYVRYVITNEPDPVRRFLSGPASEAGRHPSSRPVAQAIAEATPDD